MGERRGWRRWMQQGAGRAAHVRAGGLWPSGIDSASASQVRSRFAVNEPTFPIAEGCFDGSNDRPGTSDSRRTSANLRSARAWNGQAA